MPFEQHVPVRLRRRASGCSHRLLPVCMDSRTLASGSTSEKPMTYEVLLSLTWRTLVRP
jgi:hypothetical protein